jgi:hypothetical protein
MKNALLVVALLAGSTCALSSALADGGPAHQVRQTPPIKLGTSGGETDDASNAYCCGGTLGSAVLYDGRLAILSNNHVLARSGSAPSGDDTIQPGLIDSACRATGDNIVGDFAGNLVPLGTNNVDTAISFARSGMVDTSGFILDVGVPCANLQAPALNMQVMKSGRTTGFTTGRITSLNTSVSVRYQRGCNSGQRFTVSYSNQVVTTNMSSGGDSGSLLLSNDGTPNPVALLFAGSSSATIYNPIQDVVNAYTAGGHSFSFVGNTCGGIVEDPVQPAPSDADFQKALKIKVEHEHDLMQTPGIWGVGVGFSETDVTEAVIVVYVEKPDPTAPNQHQRPNVPKDYDGVKVRVVETDPFEAQ